MFEFYFPRVIYGLTSSFIRILSIEVSKFVLATIGVNWSLTDRPTLKHYIHTRGFFSRCTYFARLLCKQTAAPVWLKR